MLPLQMQLPPETHACSISFLQSLSTFARRGASPASTAPTPLTSPIQSPSKPKSDAGGVVCADDVVQAPLDDVAFALFNPGLGEPGWGRTWRPTLRAIVPPRMSADAADDDEASFTKVTGDLEKVRASNQRAR